MLRGTPTSQNSSFLCQGGVKLKLAGELLRQACGTIYSFRYGVSFALFKAPHQRSLQQSWQLSLGPAQSSVYGLLLAHRPVVVRAVQRWHNVVARDYAVARRNDKRLAMIAEQNPDIVRPLESAVHDQSAWRWPFRSWTRAWPIWLNVPSSSHRFPNHLLYSNELVLRDHAISLR